MPGAAMIFGDVETRLLEDGRGKLPRDVLFSDAAGELDAIVGRGYPEDLPYNCLLVRGRGSCVLVDTGLGASEHPFGGEGGSLWDELEAVDQRVEDVDVVVISHGHLDHIGGLVRDGAPAFPRARYVISAQEWAYWTSETELAEMSQLGGTAAPTHLPPLEVHGVLDRVDGETEVAPGVRVLPAPGHTAGHLAVEVEGALLYCVDAFLHRAQLGRPDLGHGLDEDAALAADSLRALLERASDRGLVVAASHMEAAFRVERWDGGFRTAAS